MCIAASFGSIANAEAIERIQYKDLYCLVQNGYYEASGDGYASVMAVTAEVVRQGPTDSRGNPIRNQCQFSWYCDGKSDSMPDGKLKALVEIVVYEALSLWYNNIDITEGATHYHADYVNPNWAKTLAYTTRIGTHKYYKWN